MRFRPPPARFLDDAVGPGELSCEIVLGGEHHVIVRAVGELDVATAGLLRMGIREARGCTPGRVIVDLRGVWFIAAQGIRVLLAESDGAVPESVAISLVASDRVHDVLRIAGVHHLLRHSQGWLADRATPLPVERRRLELRAPCAIQP